MEQIQSCWSRLLNEYLHILHSHFRADEHYAILGKWTLDSVLFTVIMLVIIRNIVSEASSFFFLFKLNEIMVRSRRSI